MKLKSLIWILSLVFGLSSCSTFLGIRTKTEKPKSGVSTKSVRYTTNRRIDVAKFEVEVLDGELNLFKNNALVRITIEGSFNKKASESVYFDEILFLEKVDQFDSTNFNRSCKIEINLLPSFSPRMKRNDHTVYDVNAETVSFKTTLEYRLYSCSFGQNTVNFKIGTENRTIELIQNK